MTGFITDNWTFALNTHRIRKVEIFDKHARVIYSDDESESFKSDSAAYKELRTFVGHLDDSSYHIVPAAPGFTLLEFVSSWAAAGGTRLPADWFYCRRLCPTTPRTQRRLVRYSAASAWPAVQQAEPSASR